MRQSLFRLLTDEGILTAFHLASNKFLHTQKQRKLRNFWNEDLIVRFVTLSRGENDGSVNNYIQLHKNGSLPGIRDPALLSPGETLSRSHRTRHRTPRALRLLQC
jgi:hypothetical protein